jgi:ribosomal protein S18 acetylase RimI-like enzyme
VRLEREMKIREIGVQDAEAFLELCKRTDAEAKYLLFEEGERRTTSSEQRERIAKYLARGNSTIFVAEDGEGAMVGYLSAMGGEAKRNRHCVHLVIGIREGFRGQGIGSALFSALEAWARAKGIVRLELGLMAENEAAFALYSKFGFVVEGRRPKAFLVDGRWIDEILMHRILA